PPVEDPELERLHLERYPDPRYSKLRAAIGGLRGVAADEVFLGNGSDEVIDMLIRVFCVPGVDSIVVCPPTYSMYGVFATFCDVSVVEVPLTSDFELRPEAVAAALTPQTKLVFLCSPGNPTGKLLACSDIEAVLAASTGAVVVVDEAYIDFAEGASVVPLLRSGRYPNLVVMQTLSKAWGLAGARLGMLLASRQIVEILNKVRAPFNVSSLTEDVAIRALGQAATVACHVQQLLSERQSVAAAIEGLALGRVFSSDANFVLFRVKNAKEVCEAIAKDGKVVARYRGSMPLCEDTIRVTIGTYAENEQFLAALRKATQ
ncbi:unnamed protein product, partial [Polarella glacialis]